MGRWGEMWRDMGEVHGEYLGLGRLERGPVRVSGGVRDMLLLLAVVGVVMLARPRDVEAVRAGVVELV